MLITTALYCFPGIKGGSDWEMMVSLVVIGESEGRLCGVAYRGERGIMSWDVNAIKSVVGTI